MADELGDEVWKQIEGYPGYWISDKKRVVSAKLHKRLMKPQRNRTSVAEFVSLTHANGKRYPVNIEKAWRRTFGIDTRQQYLDKGWQKIPHYPNYVIRADGVVKNVVTNKTLRPNMHKDGQTPTYSLYFNGQRRNTSVRTLLTQVFGEGAL